LRNDHYRADFTARVMEPSRLLQVTRKDYESALRRDAESAAKSAATSAAAVAQAAPPSPKEAAPPTAKSPKGAAERVQVTVELPCITSTPSAAGASSQGEDAPDGGEGVQLERVREGMKTRLLDLRV